MTEVEAAFLKLRKAVDQGGRAGNATYGLFDDRDSCLEFLRSACNEVIPDHSVWHVIGKERVANKWRESLPGMDSNGRRYDYFGSNELIYAGEGRFNLQYPIQQDME